MYKWNMLMSYLQRLLQRICLEEHRQISQMWSFLRKTPILLVVHYLQLSRIPSRMLLVLFHHRQYR